MMSQGTKVLITGIAGQDGSYLAEELLRHGCSVFGMELPNVVASDVALANLAGIIGHVQLFPCVPTDAAQVAAVVEQICPDECYHLGAASFVSYDFNQETSTLASNLSGTHNLLAALRRIVPACRFFFAGTSEMFGLAASEPQHELTPFAPRSIYGISKVAGHHLINYYRREHGMFACTGILFNHESPRRGPVFVTRKISMAVARIKCGFERELRLGNLDVRRDWGYAPDYVVAMRMMLASNCPVDYVISSGEVHTVREFVELAFQYVGLDYREHVIVDPAFFREAEPVMLRGDNTRIRAALGWSPCRSFPDLVKEMVENDLRLVAKQQS